MDRRIQRRFDEVAERYRALSQEYPEALEQIALAELAESVWQSNAIENSTLQLDDTERILSGKPPKREHSLREVYEARNLAIVTEELLRSTEPLTIQAILKWHGMLLAGIRDDVAGKFRSAGEWVRVGSHVGANPEFVSGLIEGALELYREPVSAHPLDDIARFHCEFEVIHPFVDGNGRIGRVIINQQLQNQGLPPAILRAKNREADYYPLLDTYAKTNSHDGMTRLLTLLTIEAMHKRFAIILSKRIITLTEWANRSGVSGTAAGNKAKRQTIPAFRVRNRWMIAEGYLEPDTHRTM